ncbi:DUF29 family protein [Anabaena catenula]|uniref:DUF29 family protein n=1 Tax=Anabaena catenula TaxID=1296320 RepID=UPI0030DA6134
MHLLKRIYVNSEYDHRGWEVTIREQRRQLRILLKQSPSLQQYFTAVLDQAWEDALMEVREDYPQIEFPDVWQYLSVKLKTLNQVGWVKRQRNPTKVRKCWVS